MKGNFASITAFDKLYTIYSSIFHANCLFFQKLPLCHLGLSRADRPAGLRDDEVGEERGETRHGGGEAQLARKWPTLFTKLLSY